MVHQTRFLNAACAAVVFAVPSAAFLPSNSVRGAFCTTESSSVVAQSRLFSASDGFDFDLILGEGEAATQYMRQQQQSSSRRGRRVANTIALPNDSVAAKVLATSAVVAAPAAPSDELADAEEDLLSQEDELLKYEAARMDEMMEDDIDIHKYTNWKEKKMGRHYPSVGELFENQDYLGIMWKWGFPIAAGVAGIGGLGRVVAVTYNTKTVEMVDSYADELIYHDGDFEEMKMCHKDWSKKLTLLKFTGGQKKRMISKYLELYAKKKTVSPQAVSSLSYVFSLYKLTEQQAAKLLCEVAKTLENKPASAGKLLFFGTHILKSPEAKDALQPIQQMLAASYKVGGDMFVKNSQKAMGEAAYKSAVTLAGKEQLTLTAGWEILGLDQEVAERIFTEATADGFLTEAQKLYGGLNEHKFSAKGIKIDDAGEALNPEEVEADDDDDSPAGTVFECGECGYTMFPAKGREFKFIPAEFVCPECGAAREKFFDPNKTEANSV
jgi:rubredoxin